MSNWETLNQENTHATFSLFNHLLLGSLSSLEPPVSSFSLSLSLSLRLNLASNCCLPPSLRHTSPGHTSLSSYFIRTSRSCSLTYFVPLSRWLSLSPLPSLRHSVPSIQTARPSASPPTSLATILINFV